MKKIVKDLGALLLTILIPTSVAIAKDPCIEAKALLCEGFPATILVIDGEPSYRIVNTKLGDNPLLVVYKDGKIVDEYVDESLRGVEPVCVKYHHPVTVDGTGSTVYQDCEIVDDYSGLEWAPSDIRPSDVDVSEEDGVIQVTVDGETCRCN